MTDYRVASTPELIALNARANELGLNRKMDPTWLERVLDPDGSHLLRPMALHEHKALRPTDPHMRCIVLMKVKGRLPSHPYPALLDVFQKDLEALAAASLPDAPSDAQQ